MSVVSARMKGWIANRDGVAAIEFAFIMPIFALVLLGAIEYCRVISVYRKLTLTTRTVTDLTTQYLQMSNADVSTVLNASSTIMVPFSTTQLKIVLSQINTDSAGKSTVSWSKTLNGTALVAGTTVTMPTGSTQASTSVILSQVTYAYTPIFGSQFVKPVTLSDRISMSPRLSATVDLTGS